MVFIKTFDELTNLELLQIMKLRQEVFMVEQKIIETDIDSHDETCKHLFIKRGGQIVSYARLLYINEQPYVGRVVTDINFRNQGLSTEIIEYLKERHESLALSAQLPKVPFYKKLGFQIVGKKYMEAGIPHQKMIYIK
ncbi:GNAT family N-acetyltransferase [Acholeplasma hippikon]|uniref:Putative acyltransferase n=1 Tax=Acholeplasma hippikon TaxID=264636 RepID=A0A449BJU6_9MOLU|nr:GNAT family N-acetyltransferase [Acholeplasma hippikon]VEU82597.1 putative acyltransferase [Acholeplasma hippikon]